ncbi:hypothetical protein [Parachitinimonas caeni]|uniref:Uncharacterized protein n=1 Tax=Parachitinimonas caeni TaxID=3031301 RepID=A0ABT7E2G1_9NEIS|nr:hypothetical protein [Parachitinimonas caeni]MDK2126497.1 hypothetical protein [Parachitinimonas caeni]
MKTADSAVSVRAEQGGNRLDTGLVPAEVIDLLVKYSDGWGQKPVLAVWLFRALLRLCQAHPYQEEGFTSLELAEMVAKVQGKVWILDLSNQSDVSRKVRDNWDQLVEKRWGEKQEGIHLALRHAGFPGKVVLQKFESKGGAGNPTRYTMRYLPAEPSDAASPVESDPVRSCAAVQIHYFPEDVTQGNTMLRMLCLGYQVVGWRRGVFLGLITLIVLTVMTLLLTFLMGLAWRSLEVRGGELLVLLLGAACVVEVAWPILNLPTARVVMTPFWLSWDAGLVLEWRRPPDGPQAHIVAVRYIGQCPICGGRVTIRSGGLRFWGRLVGSCEASPREHVYRFDHVTRVGGPLV